MVFSVGVATIPAFAQRLGMTHQMPENGAGTFMNNMGHGMMGGSEMGRGMMGGSMMGGRYNGMMQSMNGGRSNNPWHGPQPQSRSVSD